MIGPTSEYACFLPRLLRDMLNNVEIEGGRRVELHLVKSRKGAVHVEQKVRVDLPCHLASLG